MRSLYWIRNCKFWLLGNMTIQTVVCLAVSAPVMALEVIEGPSLIMNPSGRAPLAAVVLLRTDVPTEATISVSDGADNWSREFTGFRTYHELKVLGLKPETSNTISIILQNQAAEMLDVSPVLQAVTPPLPDDFPEITVLKTDPENTEPGFLLLDKFSRGPRAPGTTYTIILDAEGDVVWFSEGGGSVNRQTDTGRILARNGNAFSETDLFGRLVKLVDVKEPAQNLHHELYPTSRGTFYSLMREVRTIEDFPTSYEDPAATATKDILDEPVIEFDQDGNVLNKWDLVDILDPTRIAYDSLRDTRSFPGAVDWVHTNAVAEDPGDGGIIVSARHQDAVFKFAYPSGELQWILGDPVNWPAEFQQYLLTPQGAPFSWQFHQHAPMITHNGTLLLFDNGNYRVSPFDGQPIPPEETYYSRAIEYRIDEENMTVEQVWQYGEEILPRLYTNRISDADSLPVTDNILITFGAVSYVGGVPSPDLGLGDAHVRIVQVDHTEPANKVFDVQLHDPDPARLIQVYRSDWILSLYPPSIDTDGDSVIDGEDNCSTVSNLVQLDSDLDGYGNHCDADLDNSGFVNYGDLASFKQAFGSDDSSADFNGDGVVNFGDLATLRRSFGKPPGPSGADLPISMD